MCSVRGEEYAAGARLGAPGAVQIADHWHLLPSLRDAVAPEPMRNHFKLGRFRLQGSKAPEPPEEFVQQPVPTGLRPHTRREKEKGLRDGVREARHRERCTGSDRKVMAAAPRGGTCASAP